MRLIDADELKALYEDLDDDLRLTVRVAKANIDDMPTVEPKHGRWIKYKHYVECPLCHRKWNSDYNDIYAFNYCPNCGAKMDEVEE